VRAKGYRDRSVAVRARRFLAIALVALMAIATGHLSSRSVRAQTVSPNVILIIADDMRWDEAGIPTALHETFPAGYLPNIKGTLVANGFYATNAFNVNNLCCPSRASILTGNYSHTTGVWNNTGGFFKFQPRESSTLATWFDAAGYRTALVGKYLNVYNTASYIPVGWDRWVAFIYKTIGYYNYTLTVDGTSKAYGSTAPDYSTDVLSGYATDFIRSVPAGTPFFLDFTPYTPHAPYTPSPKYAGTLSSYKPAMPPNVAEADVSDKPAWVRKLPSTAGTGWAGYKRKQMEMLMSLDDAVGAMLSALSDTGQLDNTIILFVSDNGLSGGSHRWTTKKAGWDEGLRSPFIAWGPGIDPGTTSDQLIALIDIADTLSALTGVPVPATDGSSVAGLLESGTTPVHDGFVFEHLIDGSNPPPSYCGYRTLDYKYMRYSTGEEELYDLRADPWEMHSLQNDPSMVAVKGQLATLTRQLCNPPPPGYSFGP